MPKFHPFLKEQCRETLRASSSSGGPALRRFIRAVNRALWERETDHRLLKRSLELSTRETDRKENHLREILRLFPDFLLVINRDGIVVESHGDGPNNTGHPSGFWLKKPLGSFLNPTIGERFQKVFESKTDTPLEFTTSHQGALLFHEAHLYSLDDGQTVAMIRNITKRKIAQSALQASEERYTLATQAANDGLWDWDLVENRITFSVRWKMLLGYEDKELGNTTDVWLDRVHQDDRPAIQQALDSLRFHGKNDLEVEHRVRHRDEEHRWMLTRAVVVRGDDGTPLRIVGSQTDITPRKQAEERLRHEAFHDRLTGLANRSLFLDRLSHLLDRLTRHPANIFAVIYVDLDRFSAINERLGHDAADRLLKGLAGRLKSFARVGDTVARLGDDEYAVLLDGIPDDRAAVVFAERMGELISTPLDVGPEEVTVTASMGVTIHTREGTRAETLLNEAESAMQRAKRAGKNRVEVFDRETFARLISKLKIETDLRRAAENGEFEMYYQPIVSMTDRRLIRFESLIRWNHPQKGMVSPLDFIPLAEENGLILPIGEWVLKNVATQTQKWKNEGLKSISVAVNFSPRQFQQQGLLIAIGSALTTFKESGFSLEIEITEGAAMQDVEQSVKLLRSLQEMGVRISMDDFGVGYSSLSCLRLFPINALKIDRAFVSGVPKMKDNTALTNAIIGIGHNLGLSVVAEGVETEEQFGYLRSQGCEEAQGYLLGRPTPASNAARLLQ